MHNVAMNLSQLVIALLWTCMCAAMLHWRKLVLALLTVFLLSGWFIVRTAALQPPHPAPSLIRPYDPYDPQP